MRIDIVSDLHFDFYNIDAPGFVRAILPEEPSEVLLIAGDLGHYNEQNAQVLRSLREIGGYEHVLVVHGNHDLYIPPRAYEDSWERLVEMQARTRDRHAHAGQHRTHFPGRAPEGDTPTGSARPGRPVGLLDFSSRCVTDRGTS